MIAVQVDNQEQQDDDEPNWSLLNSSRGDVIVSSIRRRFPTDGFSSTLSSDEIID